MKRSILAALVLGAGVVAWVASGELQYGDADAKNEVATPAEAVVAEAETPAARPSVRVRSLTAEPYERKIVVRGRTEAVRWVEAKAEIPGRIGEILVEKGGRVRAGDVLVRLDMEDRAARMAEAQARVEQRQLEYEAVRALSEKGYRARTKFAEATALMEAALAGVARMEQEIDDTELRAPFAGIVEYRHVEIGDYVEEGAAVATVVDQDPYLVIGYVSEQDVGKLALDNRGTATLITGETLSGHIRYIASMAEPQTRTFRIELEVPNSNESLRDGITAELRIGVETVAAHFVSPAVLTLDDDGVIGVRLVDEGDRVVFHRAEIVGDSEGGVWLASLPETVRLITVGQEFVRDGDVVEASPEEDAPDA